MGGDKKQEIIKKVPQLDKIEEATVYGMIKGIEAMRSIKPKKERKKKAV